MTFKTLLTAAALLTGGAAHAGDLAITITGVQPDQGGQILVSLQTAEDFMQPRGTAGARLDPAEGGLSTTLKDVPPGEYALSVMHDANGSGHMEFQENGWPAEGWAMSGEPPMDRAPLFGDAKFTVSEDDSEITLDMIYPGAVSADR